MHCGISCRVNDTVGRFGWGSFGHLGGLFQDIVFVVNTSILCLLKTFDNAFHKFIRMNKRAQ